MKNLLSIIIVFFLCTPFIYADDSIDALECADSFFKHLQNGEYSSAWTLLTVDSQERIVKEIVSSYKDTAEKAPSVSDVNKDFSECSDICTSYWKGFVLFFDPSEALEKSTWTISKVKKEYVEINLMHKNSSAPAVLKIYKEKSAWRFGLTESFWLRKYFQN